MNLLMKRVYTNPGLDRPPHTTPQNCVIKWRDQHIPYQSNLETCNLQLHFLSSRDV